MSLLKTRTPDYQGQNNSTIPRQPGWLDWFGQLFRTQTPRYLSAPVQTARAREVSER